MERAQSLANAGHPTQERSSRVVPGRPVSAARRLTYPLNPVDNMLLATHEALRKRGYCGLNVLLIAELDGELDPAALAAAAERLAQEFPALSARIAYSTVLWRARWVLPATDDGQPALEFESHRVPAGGDVDAPLRAAFGDSLDPRHGAQVRLIHVALGGERHRLALRWPHHLMDLEGGVLLLRELGALLGGQPLTLGRDPRAARDAPFRAGMALTVWHALRGTARHLGYCLVNQPRLVRKPRDGAPHPNFLLRHFDAGQRQRFEEQARRRTAPGPLRYSRAVMIAAVRTYLQMAQERGRPRKHYVCSHALPLPAAGVRPGLHSNLITLPWFGFTAADLATWATADAAAVRQIEEYTSRRRDAANWTMLRMASRWPFPVMRYLARHRHPRAAVGLTSYRFGREPLHMGGAVVARLAHTATMNCHPGWVLADSTYRDALTISVGYFEDHVDSASMSEFCDHLERALL